MSKFKWRACHMFWENFLSHIQPPVCIPVISEESTARWCAYDALGMGLKKEAGVCSHVQFPLFKISSCNTNEIQFRNVVHVLSPISISIVRHNKGLPYSYPYWDLSWSLFYWPSILNNQFILQVGKKAIHSNKLLVTNYNTIQYCDLEENNLNFQCHENPKIICTLATFFNHWKYHKVTQPSCNIIILR
jgi:hypothetical protein